MPTPILMPRPGQMTEECTVQLWLKHEGDPVHKGDVLFEIETDKASMEVESFDEGTLLRILVEEGQTVPVNTVVAWVGQPGEAIPETPEPAIAALVAAAAPDASPPVSAPVAASSRVVPPPAAIVASPAPGAVAQPGARLAISPRASRLAAELGVDPRSVSGSGPGGRIVERDIQSAATAIASPPIVLSPAAPAEPQGGAFEQGAASEPLTRLRQVIAARLTESITTIPHFAVTVAVDMSGLVALRAELRRDGSPISLTDIIHHATVQTLVEFPLVNARTDGRQLWRREHVHLGIAVSVPGGLLVPVIRDAEHRSLPDLHDAAASLVERARASRLGPDELTGSTFTISNMGMYGVEQFTAIINPGESGIVAVSSIAPTAVAVGDGLAVRQMMRLTLSADHRLVDGELGARFLNAVRRRLEDVDGYRRELANA